MGFFDDNNDERSSTWLRDVLGNNVAEVRKSGDRSTLHDRLGNRLGTYDAREDVTRDPIGNFVGKGNWLATLFGRR